jgi:hypothetical protein
MMHLKLLEKQEQTKPKSSRQKEKNKEQGKGWKCGSNGKAPA